MAPKLAVPPSASGFVTTSPPVAGIGAPSVAAVSVKVNLPATLAGPVRPAGTVSDFSTGMVAVAGVVMP